MYNVCWNNITEYFNTLINLKTGHRNFSFLKPLLQIEIKKNDFNHVLHLLKSASHQLLPDSFAIQLIYMNEQEKFIPKGAMAFFILLITLCAVIWFGIYFLMLNRN